MQVSMAYRAYKPDAAQLGRALTSHFFYSACILAVFFLFYWLSQAERRRDKHTRRTARQEAVFWAEM